MVWFFEFLPRNWSRALLQAQILVDDAEDDNAHLNLEEDNGNRN